MNALLRSPLAMLLAGLVVGGAAGFLVASNESSAPAAKAPVKAPAPARKPAAPLDKVAQDIAKGGYILYFRHGNREKWDSVIAFDVYEMATAADSALASYKDAVCLSPQGVEEARMIGKILALAKVPVKTVVSSPSCRAMQTAKLAFGRVDQVSNGLAHTPATNARNRAEFAAEIKRVLSTVPAGPGEVTVIAAHGNTLENHPEIFAEGAEMIRALLQETGFYVIARDADGKLRVVQRFQNLGEFAANAIDLRAKAP